VINPMNALKRILTKDDAANRRHHLFNPMRLSVLGRIIMNVITLKNPVEPHQGVNMASQPSTGKDDQIPRHKALRHGEIEFDGKLFPASISDYDLMAYVPIRYICDYLGIEYDNQIERIMKHRLLREGMANLPFETRYLQSKRMTNMHAICVTHLHSWLFGIYPENLGNEDGRETLYAMQKELRSVIYAWMGQQSLPEDMRAEAKAHMDPRTLEITEAVESAHDAVELAELAHARVDETGKKVEGLEERVAKMEARWQVIGEEHINGLQQDRFLVMVKLVGEQLAKKNLGDIGTFRIELKSHFAYPDYRLIKPEQFPAVIKYCADRYRRLINKPGTPLPPVFTDPDQPSLI